MQKQYTLLGWTLFGLIQNEPDTQSLVRIVPLKENGLYDYRRYYLLVTESLLANVDDIYETVLEAVTYEGVRRTINIEGQKSEIDNEPFEYIIKDIEVPCVSLKFAAILLNNNIPLTPNKIEALEEKIKAHLQNI